AGGTAAHGVGTIFERSPSSPRLPSPPRPESDSSTRHHTGAPAEIWVCGLGRTASHRRLRRPRRGAGNGTSLGRTGLKYRFAATPVPLSLGDLGPLGDLGGLLGAAKGALTVAP